MATLTLASLWLSSLLVVGCAGWIIGQAARANRLPLSQSERTSVDAASKGTAKSAAKSAASGTTVAITLSANAKRRANLFDNMPPVESVRAQARMILQTEKVWGEADTSGQLTCLTRDFANTCAFTGKDPAQLTSQVDQPASSSTLV